MLRFHSAGGATVAWPLVAGAQQPAMPVIGVLLGMSESNPEHRSFFDAFIEELTRLGWKDGRTARIEQRWANADSTAHGRFHHRAGCASAGCHFVFEHAGDDGIASGDQHYPHRLYAGE